MIFLIKEVYERLPHVNDENRAFLINSSCKIFDQQVLSPFNDFDNLQVISLLFVITIQYGDQFDLAPSWRCLGKWRHHQCIIINYFISLLETFGESIHLKTIQSILSWINSAVIKNNLLSRLSPSHITDRNPLDSKIIQLFNEASKTFTAKKKLYDPQTIFDAHSAFILLCLRDSKLGDWLYYSIIFAFDPTSDEYVRKLALGKSLLMLVPPWSRI